MRQVRRNARPMRQVRRNARPMRQVRRNARPMRQVRRNARPMRQVRRNARPMREGDVVVMDNLSARKVKCALGPIRGMGAAVPFLPPHGPDRNPIGPCWSKMRAALRRLKARTYGELMAAMGTALDEITASDIPGWFRHCGYC